MTDPQTPPPTLTEFPLPANVKQALNTALVRGRLVSVAYVSPDGRPQLSYRGSVQAYSDTQLAIWVRDPAGGMLKAMSSNPYIAVMYGDLDPAAYGFVTFKGRGRVDESDAVRHTVYFNSAKGEQDRDKDQKGKALIIDLDSVDGFYSGVLLKLRH